MQIFDTHTHLDSAIYDSDRDTVLQRFRQVGGERLLLAGVSMTQWRQAAELCDQVSDYRMSIGYHPLFAAPKLDLLSEQLDTALQTFGNHVVAIGECGLDIHAGSPLAHQLAILNPQLSFAVAANLPVVLHCRGAHNQLLNAITTTGVKRGVIHAFSGSYELANEYIRRGFYLGVGGTISYPRASKTRATIARIGLEHLVAETDSPDMPHFGQQGQRNEPARCADTIYDLAELKNIDVTDVAQHLWQNANTLFGISL